MNMMKETKGRRCYDHLGGDLSVAIFNFLVENQWIQLEEGRSTVYVITDKGREEFKKLGIQV